MRIALLMNREELNALQYPVVVEMYSKVKESGSKRRKYLAEFSEYERRKIKELYELFYRWHLVRGTPEELMFRSAKDIDFVKRVIHFFATL